MSSSDWTIKSSKDYANFLVFTVSRRFNNLQSVQNPNRYSEKQYETYRLIKSLHEKGLGFTRIAEYLNSKNIKTLGRNRWVSNDVNSVLNRYRQKEERLALRNRKYEIKRSKMLVKFMRCG